MFQFFSSSKSQMVDQAKALPGRDTPIVEPGNHHVSGRPMAPPYPESLEVAIFGMGCFWGAERVFWQADGVWVTSVGYAGGPTPNPTYREVCTGQTGHTEVVQVVFDPERISYDALLKLFWEAHDPTQEMRQGNDVGTQYRSFLGTTTPEQLRHAEASKVEFNRGLREAGFGDITTEIVDSPAYFFAEEYHQQYLSKDPNGYCGLKGTGVACSIGGRPADAG